MTSQTYKRRLEKFLRHSLLIAGNHDKSIIHMVDNEMWADATSKFGFQGHFRVIKVNEVIIGKMSVYMRSDEHKFRKLQSNIIKSLFLSH